MDADTTLVMTVDHPKGQELRPQPSEALAPQGCEWAASTANFGLHRWTLATRCRTLQGQNMQPFVVSKLGT